MRNTYSLHGLVEWIGSVPLQVCHFWIAPSYCMPGSPQIQVPSAILLQQLAASFLSSGLPVVTDARPPFLAVERGLHEFVAHAHGKIFVLVHDAAVGVAVVGAVVTLLDQRPGLLLLLLLGVDEFLDVAVPVAQRVHLGGAARLAAGLHHVGDLVINLAGTTAGRWAGRRR